MTRSLSLFAVCCLMLAGLCACSFGGGKLASESPALAGWDEPLSLRAEPNDELVRAALDPGSFTGIEVVDARASLDALLDAPQGLAVARVIENSPAARAGIAAGDVLYSARLLPDGKAVDLAWPSEWRGFELSAAPGREIEVTLDRAGADFLARIELVPRYRQGARTAVARLREDQRAGVVVRGATEVEARAANLGSGAGAVIVGLAADSPWRKADLRFEDLIIAVDGERVGAPDVLIGRIRAAQPGDVLQLDLLRDGAALKIAAPLTQRKQELTEFSIPLVFSYESTAQSSETSLLLGLFNYERSRVAWKLRLFWLINFKGGDSDRLEELGS